jgi:hypothetical protein
MAAPNTFYVVHRDDDHTQRSFDDLDDAVDFAAALPDGCAWGIYQHQRGQAGAAKLVRSLGRL